MNRYLLLSACLLFAIVAVGGDVTEGTKRADQISLSEAETLIYVLPEAHHVRAEGMDIGWEREEASKRNSEHFYYFFVYNAKRQGTASVTIGHFAVSRHTAEVWDTVLVERVRSAEIEGIQRIIRQAHGIEPEMLKQFGGIEP